MSRSEVLEEKEGEDDRARAQVGGGSDGPPMRSMSREDSCASATAAATDDDYNRNVNGARILFVCHVLGLFWEYFLRDNKNVWILSL